MATMVDGDVSIAANGDIRWTGATTVYNTVLEFHRWLMDKADDAIAAGNDLMDITFPEPSDRSTDNIITLLSPYNIDDAMAEQLFDGSITQDNGNTLYSGLEVKGVVVSNTELVIIQDGAVLTSWWDDGTVMINDDPANLIILRTLIKSREFGVDIDGKKILLTSREFGDTYSEFPVTLGLGNATGAISTEDDLNNNTAQATVNAWAITNVEGYQTIDLNNGNGAQPYYSQWNRDVQTINGLYEFAKDIQRRTTAETIHGISGALFRGITHQWDYDGEVTGFTEDDTLAWGATFTFDNGVNVFALGDPVTFGAGGSGQVVYYSGAGATGTMVLQLSPGSIQVTNAHTITEVGTGANATCDVLAIDSLGSQTAGGTGLSISSARYFGIVFDTSTTAKFDNSVVDAIVVGNGIRVYGTSTTNDTYGDILTADEGTIGNKYGYYRSDNEVIYCKGQTLMGDNVGTNAATLTSTNRTIVFEALEYKNSSGTWVTAVSTTFHSLKRVGNSTNGTALTLGDGTTIQSGLSPNGITPDITIDLDDTHTGTGADLTINGARFSGISTSFDLSVNGAHTMDGTIINDCTEVTGAGDGSDGIVIRTSTFQNYSGESAALLWGGAGMDIRTSQFINNNGGTASHGIRHTDGTTSTYYDLTFSGNDADVYLNHASANLTINKDGTANPTSYTSSGTGTVTFVGTVNIKVTVKNSAGTGIVGARVFIQAGDTGAAPYYDSVSIVSTGTTATATHTTHGLTTGQFVAIRGANELAYNGVFTITNTGANTYTYTMLSDPVDTATGTITSTQVFMNEDTIAGGIAEQSFNSGATQNYEGRARKASVTPKYKLATFSGSDISGGIDIPVQLIIDE